MNNFLFVHQCNREQYIITGLIESHEEAKSSCLSAVSGLLRGLFLQREKIEGGGKKGQREKKETGRPNFTNSQTDIGYTGEGGTAAAHSRRGRDVSEWWKQAWTVCCPSVLLADKTTSQWRCQNIWVSRMAVLRVERHNFSLSVFCPQAKCFVIWFLAILIVLQERQEGLTKGKVEAWFLGAPEPVEAPPRCPVEILPPVLLPSRLFRRHNAIILYYRL